MRRSTKKLLITSLVGFLSSVAITFITTYSDKHKTIDYNIKIQQEEGTKNEDNQKKVNRTEKDDKNKEEDSPQNNMQSSDESTNDKMAEMGQEHDDNIEETLNLGENNGNEKKMFNFDDLYFYGRYEFGEYITMKDIRNMKDKIDSFNIEEISLKLKEKIDSLGNNSEDIEDIRKRIKNFDYDKKFNESVLTDELYYKNALDRLYFYIHEGLTEYLEQAAISAEGAVEEIQIKEYNDYISYIQYIEISCLAFFEVLNLNPSRYASGSEIDVKYRIGKLLYKPVANLEDISRNDRFYLLCSSYIIFDEAIQNSTYKNTYSVEMAYYYLKVCVDLIGKMNEEEEQQLIKEQGIWAYREFLKRGELNLDNKTFKKYKEEAEKMNEKLNNL